MYAYIKDRLSFSTIRKLHIIDMTIEEGSDASSRIAIPPDAATSANRGDWILVDGILLIIDEVKQNDARIDLKLTDFESAFSRPLVMPASTPATTELFVAACLEAVQDDDDEMYRMPYLSITTAGSTAFIPPASVDNDGVFDLAKYLRELRYNHNIRLQYSIAGRSLAIVVAKVSPSERAVVIGRKNVLVTTPVFSGSSPAKIITLPSGVAYYLHPDGTFDTDPTVKRVYGAIKTLNTSGKTSAETQSMLASAFAKGRGEMKIEWLSQDAFDVGDQCTVRVNGEVYSGVINAKVRYLNDGRCRYTIGALATTLTEKLKEARDNK